MNFIDLLLPYTVLGMVLFGMIIVCCGGYLREEIVWRYPRIEELKPLRRQAIPYAQEILCSGLWISGFALIATGVPHQYDLKDIRIWGAILVLASILLILCYDLWCVRKIRKIVPQLGF